MTKNLKLKRLKHTVTAEQLMLLNGTQSVYTVIYYQIVYIIYPC